MLLIAGLIQPLTQQPRYYRLTTVRQPLRHISWFVPTTRSRLAAARPVRLTPELPLTTVPSLEASHQHRHRPRGHLVTAPPQRRHLRSSRF